MRCLEHSSLRGQPTHRGTADVELRFYTVENPELTYILHFKPAAGQNIAMIALPTARHFCFCFVRSIFDLPRSFVFICFQIIVLFLEPRKIWLMQFPVLASGMKMHGHLTRRHNRLMQGLVPNARVILNDSKICEIVRGRGSSVGRASDTSFGCCKRCKFP